MSKTVDSIMEDMENRVRENQPVSPAMWVDAAIKLNALKGDLDNDIAEYEGGLAEREATYIEKDMPAAKAKILAKNNGAYPEYLKAKAKSARIIEFIRLAKHRSKIEEI